MCTDGSASPNNFALADWEEAGTSVAGAPSVRECDAWTTTPLGIGGILAPIASIPIREFEKINTKFAPARTATRSKNTAAEPVSEPQAAQMLTPPPRRLPPRAQSIATFPDCVCSVAARARTVPVLRAMESILAAGYPTPSLLPVLPRGANGNLSFAVSCLAC